jgi:hypothetical protein
MTEPQNFADLPTSRDDPSKGLAPPEPSVQLECNLRASVQGDKFVIGTAIKSENDEKGNATKLYNTVTYADIMSAEADIKLILEQIQFAIRAQYYNAGLKAGSLPALSGTELEAL